MEELTVITSEAEDLSSMSFLFDDDDDDDDATAANNVSDDDFVSEPAPTMTSLRRGTKKNLKRVTLYP